MRRLCLFYFTLIFSLYVTLALLKEATVFFTIKASLDPRGLVLASWTSNGDPCYFEGVACDELGRVTNISLQAKTLSGHIPPEIGEIKSLTGLYLHYNSLHGQIPLEISTLTHLIDLYLNFNNLSGPIPPQIGNMFDLQVLQLCYNELGGGIPEQMGSLPNLTTIALQHNSLTGAIPSTLGDLTMLRRLDLSFNTFSGSIPLQLSDVLSLQILDVRNNSLSGFVPPALKRLGDGFQLGGNVGLCGAGFLLKNCSLFEGVDPLMPKSTEEDPQVFHPEHHPISSNAVDCYASPCFKSTRTLQLSAISGGVAIILSFSTIAMFTFSWYRRHKQRIGSFVKHGGGMESGGKLTSPCPSSSLISTTESYKGWDPAAAAKCMWQQEECYSFMLSLEEVESATSCFSDVNLVGRGSFSSVHKGVMNDGAVVAVKCIARRCLRSDEDDFAEGMKEMTLLKHDNLVRFRGFCCSGDRGECFLVHDFSQNGTLSDHFDVENGSRDVLNWSTRVSIIIGIAKGIAYLHSRKESQPARVHQRISAEKVVLGEGYTPHLLDCGLHRLLANDVVFSSLKSYAAMGYLAPEYTTTGRLTMKSDTFAFGVVIYQILTGRRKISSATMEAAAEGRLQDFIDANLEGVYPKIDAEILRSIAAKCTNEYPNQRPAMADLVAELLKSLL